MKSLVIKYGLVLFVILSVLKFLEYQFFSHKLPLEIYIAIVSTLFLSVGFLFAKYWLFKNISENDTHNITADKPIDLQKLSEFSQREQQVLQLLCYGYANKEIAKSLNISPNTVKTHLSRVFKKLDVHNRTEALSEAKALNLVA